MPKKLKVYGVTTICKPEDLEDVKQWRVQCRYVAAVFNQKEFADLFGTTIGQVKDMCITGNKKEIELAMAKPHTLIFIEVR